MKRPPMVMRPLLSWSSLKRCDVPIGWFLYFLDISLERLWQVSREKIKYKFNKFNRSSWAVGSAVIVYYIRRHPRLRVQCCFWQFSEEAGVEMSCYFTEMATAQLLDVTITLKHLDEMVAADSTMTSFSQV